MKLKDLNVSQVMVIKYLACKFIIEYFKPSTLLDEVVNTLTKERLAEKHNIDNAKSKTLNDVIYEITKDKSEGERESLVSTTYDYIVNKLFSVENFNPGDSVNPYPESIIIYPTNADFKAKLFDVFETYKMQVMTKKYFEEMRKYYKPREAISATAQDSGDEYVLVIA